MGYNIKPGLVDANIDTLASIKASIMKGELAIFPCAPAELSALQYRIFKLLKAAELFRTEGGGEYVGLRAATRVIMDAATSSIRVMPNSQASLKIVQRQPNEVEAVAKLDSFPGDMTDIEFVPSNTFTVDKLAQLVADKGWELHQDSLFTIPESDRVAYFCERVVVSSGFDAIST